MVSPSWLVCLVRPCTRSGVVQRYSIDYFVWLPPFVIVLITARPSRVYCVLVSYTSCVLRAWAANDVRSLISKVYRQGCEHCPQVARFASFVAAA
eukprot:3689705-Alexandrium_andersonii.AAC.1